MVAPPTVRIPAILTSPTVNKLSDGLNFAKNNKNVLYLVITKGTFGISAAGAIAALLGALGGILTLLYLSRQIENNSKQLEVRSEK